MINPPKIRILFFDCSAKGVSIETKVYSKTGFKYKTLGIAKNLDEMKKLVKDINLQDDSDVCLFSSSMDFPKEHTSDKDIIAICEKLRG